MHDFPVPKIKTTREAMLVRNLLTSLLLDETAVGAHEHDMAVWHNDLIEGAAKQANAAIDPMVFVQRTKRGSRKRGPLYE